MKLEDQVCSLELAKRLKELGVKQESVFWWNDIDDNNDIGYPVNRIELLDYSFISNYCASYSAFTVAELGEMLPKSLMINGNLCSMRISHGNNWYINYEWQKVSAYDESEANARAKMLIHLLENKLMELPK